MKKLILTVLFAGSVCNLSFAQFNPLEIIDKVAGTLLPEVVSGVKSIQEAKRKDKDKEAKMLEEKFKLQQEKAVESAKSAILEQIGEDIEYLDALNNIQLKVQRISLDVGRLSMFKDQNFVNRIRNQVNVTAKNEVVRKFQNSLQQINNNKAVLGSLRDQLGSTSIPANAKSAIYIGAIVSKLEEINSSYDDCAKQNILSQKEKELNGCLDAISSISSDIAFLENYVENLGIETSTMLVTYTTRFKKIKGDTKSK